MYCPGCGLESQNPTAKFCGACGRQLSSSSKTEGSPSHAAYYGTSAFTPILVKASTKPANFGAILALILLVLVSFASSTNGSNAVTFVCFTAASIIGVWLVSTNNVANRIIGAVQIILLVLACIGLVKTYESSHISGTYSDGIGDSISLTADGRFSMILPGNTSNGRYQVQNSVISFDPTNGNAPNDPNSSSSAIYQTISPLISGTVSSDQNQITLGGVTYTRPAGS